MQSDIDAIQPDMVGPSGTSKILEYWDEQDDIPLSIYCKAIVKSYEPGRKTTGYDVARDGVGRSVAARWENLTLIDGSITKIQASR